MPQDTPTVQPKKPSQPHQPLACMSTIKKNTAQKKLGQRRDVGGRGASCTKSEQADAAKILTPPNKRPQMATEEEELEMEMDEEGLPLYWVSNEEDHDDVIQFCAHCQNGGHIFSYKASTAAIASSSFICPHCIEGKWAGDKGKHTSQPYYESLVFYHLDAHNNPVKPAVQKFVKIKTFSVFTQGLQNLHCPLFIIHFALKGLSPQGSAAHGLHLDISAYLTSQYLQFVEITFDLSTSTTTAILWPFSEGEGQLFGLTVWDPNLWFYECRGIHCCSPAAYSPLPPGQGIFPHCSS
ncbi:hypothetical protein SERLADRAFT_404522 [Serpula lacrymans var. lacrymans S7.9]|uniref:Uncharacterized protein n=1 Tax=Serpula lacrymans var. lacrymans (strain S7.9) TaxID=578457 RepID=F8NDD7_SERL9|nr:uncharacterized protein SERLADRAFT_404522 [Serpula lacrymans var. lacrymans S7.9]EGO30275.1 hypothetical protein SERLADRAFT_404522 [Serpula lacrymans var. lacrymans S7.9]